MDVPLELEQWKKSIFACWGLKNEHTKNPPDIEVKHSTLNWEFGDSSISFLKSYHHKTFSSAKKSTDMHPEMEPLFNFTFSSQPFVQMMSFCFRWGVMMIFDHVFVAAPSLVTCVHVQKSRGKREGRTKSNASRVIQGRVPVEISHTKPIPS